MLRYQVIVNTTDKVITESFTSQKECDNFIATVIKEHAFKDLESIRFNTYSNKTEL